MQQIIEVTLYVLAIFIPLIFTPFTSELFEFPKFLILLSGTLIIAASWLYHIFITNNCKIKINKVGFAMIAVLITQTISTIFSVHPYTSFWGYYGRFHGGLFSIICYTIIYLAATNWLSKESTQKLINISIKTSIFVALLAVLEHYNYSLSCTIINYVSKIFSQNNNLEFNLSFSQWISNACWAASTNPGNRTFSLLGQPNWLAAYLVPHIFLLIYKFKLNKIKSNKIYYYLGFTIFLLALIFTKSRSGFLAFALGYLSYWALQIRTSQFEKIKKSLTIYTTIAAVSIALFGSPYSKSIAEILSKSSVQKSPVPAGTALENGGTESGDIRKIVWTGALKSIIQHPLLGTGPETFAYTYYQVRPIEHNQTSEWDYLYNKAHNEYLNIAAGSGILGLIAYLYLHYAIFATSLTKVAKSKKINQDQDEAIRQYYPVLGASIISFTVTSFFGFSVTPVYFCLILFMIFATTLDDSRITDPDHIPTYFYFVFPLLLIYPFRMYLADTRYTLGKRYLDSGKVEQSLPLLTEAVNDRHGLDLFHASLAEAYAQSGQQEMALKELQINQKQNPIHLNFFKSRAKVYLTFAVNDPSYYSLAAKELEGARILAPTDPKLAYNLGLIYTRTNQLDMAEKELLDTISLKPNYLEPYYALTLLYEQTKQIDKIPDLLTSAKTNLATYSAQLKEKIDKYSTN